MNSIQLLEGSEEYRMIQQTEPSIEIQIHVSVFKLFLPHIEETRYIEIITLYVPQNHLFWWIWQKISRDQPENHNGRRIDNSFLRRYSIHSSNGKISCFTGFTSKMCIIESSETCENYSDAYNSVLSVAEKEELTDVRYKGMALMMAFWINARPDFLNFVGNEQSGSSYKEYKYKVIDLNKSITDPYFYSTRCVGGPRLRTKITTVIKHQEKWQVELEGASKKTATFILDENYEVVDVFGKAVEGPSIYE